MITWQKLCLLCMQCTNVVYNCLSLRMAHLSSLRVDLSLLFGLFIVSHCLFIFLSLFCPVCFYNSREGVPGAWWTNKQSWTSSIFAQKIICSFVVLVFCCFCFLEIFVFWRGGAGNIFCIIFFIFMGVGWLIICNAF